MRLVWRVALTSVGCVLLAMGLLTAVVSYREVSSSLADLRDQQRLLAVTAASQVEAGYHDNIWPFGMLWALSKAPGFAFWQVLDENEQTVLSDGPVPARSMRDHPRRGPEWLATADPSTEEWVVPLALGRVAHPWQFRLGFRTDRVHAAVLRIVVIDVAAALGICLLLAGASIFLTRRLLGPMRSLTQAALELEKGSYDVSLDVQSEGEVGQLLAAFRAMVKGIRQRDEAIRQHVTSLQDAHDQLEERVAERTRELVDATVRVETTARERQEMSERLIATSRVAGMAEVASSVLHNVGNVLTSINVSAGLLEEALRNSKVGGLRRAVALMREHQADLSTYLATDPSGRLLIPYLGELAHKLEQERDLDLAEVSSMMVNVEHIKAIVTQQQRLARIDVDVAEDVAVSKLVDDSLLIAGSEFQKYSIKVERDLQAAAIHVDKHKVLQILVNLLSNAKQALIERSDIERRIVLRAETVGPRLRMQVSDNGVGIPRENLTRIFNHGFTTRRAGHGFGLHVSALSAMELGGTLNAQSGGRLQGATFVLDLPLRATRGLGGVVEQSA